MTAHCVRVPVFIGHSEAIFIECEKEINEEKARNILRKADGVTVLIIGQMKDMSLQLK